MPKCIKIMLVGQMADQANLLDTYIGEGASRDFTDKSYLIDMGTVQVEVFFERTPPNITEHDIINVSNVDVVLYALSKEPPANLETFLSGVDKLLSSQGKQGVTKFYIHNPREKVTASQSASSSANHLVLNESNLQLIIDQAIIKKNFTSSFSRRSGAIVGAVLGALTAIVVYNPIACLFGASSRYVKKYDDLWSEKAKHLASLLISPLWGPLKGIFYHGFYEQGLEGWKNGFKAGVKAIVKVPKQATSSNSKSRTFTRVSTRNMVASLIIAALITVAVVGVIFPPTIFGIAAILPTVLATLHIAGLSSLLLGLIAGATTFALAAILYGAVVNIYDVLANRPHSISQPSRKRANDSSLLADKPAVSFAEPAKRTFFGILRGISSVSGAVAGALIGGLTAAILHNPVASLYSAFREFWKMSKLDKLFGLPALLLSPLWRPIKHIAEEFKYQGELGWIDGFSCSIMGIDDGEKNIPSAFSNVLAWNMPNNKRGYVSARDFVASMIVIGLVAAAVLAVVLPPASLFLGIPALAAAIGLGSVGTALLAVIAGAASFVAATLIYGIASQWVDHIIEHQEAAKPANAETAGSYSAMGKGLATTAGQTPSEQETQALHTSSKPQSFSIWDWLPECCGGKPSSTLKYVSMTNSDAELDDKRLTPPPGNTF